MIKPLTGDKQPRIAAPRQAKAKSSLKSDNSLKTLQGLTFISSFLRDISLSFLRIGLPLRCFFF